METTSSTTSNITPEKLTLMKIRAGGFEREFLSEPSSPIGVPPSLDYPPALGRHHSASGHMHSSSGHMNSSSNNMSSSVARRSSGRQGSSATRRSSFLQSHRNKMSMELTSQAEGKFFALMDLMSTASREASSLKESWARMISEREALAREREELMIQVEETSETLERAQSDHHHHGYELDERKKQVEKLLLELSAAFTTVSEHKKRVADRDRELESTRAQIHELQATVSRSGTDHDRIRAELESLALRLKVAEDDRDHARHDSDRHHGELRALLREHTDLKSKHTESTTKLESTRKEVLSLTDRSKMWELERDEHLHEKDRLHEDIKRSKIRADEASRDLIELTERHDRVHRDHTKLKETVREIETERDDFALTIENLRREVKAKSAGWEEADARHAEVNLKYEHIKREVIATKEKLRDVELERTELRDSVDRSREEHRLVIIERDQLKEDIQDERRKVAEGHRRVSVLEESLRRAELTVTEVRFEVTTLTERNKVISREGEDGRTKHGHLAREIGDLKDKLVIFQAEIRTLTEARDRAYRDLNAWKHKYEEVTETITEFHDSSGELEFEIESLRTLLREAREQKERAISARHTADRERDEYVAKYEEKCREMERFEESASSHYHASSKGDGKSSFTRTVSTAGTTVHHGGKHGHSHGHGHNSVESGGIFSTP
jgi:chromosome segregation ATPase